jgi:hypothetical protein
MRRKSLAAIVGSIAAIYGFHAAAVPLQISITGGSPFPLTDENLGVVISNTVVSAISKGILSPSLALTNLAPVKVAQNATPPSKFPQFSAETLGIEIPLEDYNYLVTVWGTGEPGSTTALLWLLEGPEKSFNFSSPETGQYLLFYSLYGEKNGSAVPESAPMALLLALGCGTVLTTAWRSSRRHASCL